MLNHLRKVGMVLSIIGLTILTSSTALADDFTFGTDEAAGWALFGLGMFCIIPIIWLIIGILIAIWVYKDAEKRGTSGALWLVIVILTGIIGLIIWLVVRPPLGGEKKKESDRRCPNCGRAIPMDARSCPYCNKKFES